MSRAPQSRLIAAIAAFKLVKAILLLLVGLGALHLLHRDLTEVLTGLARHLHVDPEGRYAQKVLARAFQVSPAQLKEIAAGTFFYAALLGTEGVGLFLRRRWAEYFTVIATSLFVPLEIYEIVEHLTAARVAVLLVNLATVWYLALRLRHSRG